MEFLSDGDNVQEDCHWVSWAGSCVAQGVAVPLGEGLNSIGLLRELCWGQGVPQQLTIQPPPSVLMSQNTCTRWLRSPLMEMV